MSTNQWVLAAALVILIAGTVWFRRAGPQAKPLLRYAAVAVIVVQIGGYLAANEGLGPKQIAIAVCAGLVLALAVWKVNQADREQQQ